MKFNAAPLLTVAALVLINACAGSTPNPNVFRQAPLRAQSNVRTLTTVDQLVERGRMEQYLAALSGKAALGPEGTIPERGTVQGRNMTRAFLSKTLESLGYKPEAHNYRPNGTNIMARLMADVPTDEYIVIGAHLDSVRNAGADDNGSGTTAVLEAATVLRQLPNRKVNILFAWFDEEELGLIGSRYLARDLKKQGMKITSMHNIDMLGYDGDRDKAIELAQPDGILWDYYNMVNRSRGFNLPLDRTNTGQSDHESFHGQGFHAICISEEYTSGDTTPEYHRKGDVFATINFDYLTTSTRLVVAVVGDMALKVPAPPAVQSIPNDRFPSRPRAFHASYDEHVH
ncbi:MAG: M28 family metallopeptidase [Candidatus Sericytochromatia bacterium]